MRTWKTAVPAVLAAALLVAAVSALVPLDAASAKGPKNGTWESYPLAEIGFGETVLLDTTTGAAQFFYRELDQTKTFPLAAPAGAPRGTPGAYAIAKQSIQVNFGMGDQPTIVLFHTGTGASWYFNGGQWTQVVRTTGN